MPKRPHCDLIKAWADGAEIQYLCQTTDQWIDTSGPMWSPMTNYRIKPQTIKYRVALFLNMSSSTFYTSTAEGEDNNWEKLPAFVRWLTDWVEVEIDPTTSQRDSQ